MRISKSRISYLLKVYSDGKATTEEEKELFKCIAHGGKEAPIKKHIEGLVSWYNSNEVDSTVDWENLYQKIIEEINSMEINSLNFQPVMRKIIWLRGSVAAAVLLMLGIGYFFLTAAQKEQKNLSRIEQPKTNDIAPPNTVNAVLTLSNGQKIILESTCPGTIAKQGSVNVIKLANGEISYRGTSNEIQYNTLSNPRGSKVINLVLADGSKVWLNTASSLRYPTAFTGNERKVEIIGETYLEVAHNPAMPFIVSKGNASIKVLGTHFNVKAYDDESSLNVTLLKGRVSVAVKDNQQPKVIKPGEQAQISKNGSIAVANSVDLEKVMAWKNEVFFFKGADIESIMREISRWYDIDVIFEKPVGEKFYAEVSRNTNVSTLLQMLDATKAVHFKIEGKTIRVMPR